KADGFMEALRGARSDLAGLPFAMGDACRTKGDRSRELTRAVATVRAALRGQSGVQTRAGTIVLSAPPAPADAPAAAPSPALARLAIFSEEDDVRQAAVAALRVRRERDYTDVLLRGLRYPWPAVAQRAAEAVARLERTDLVPALVDLLDQPDPRAPVAREED